MDSMEIIKGIQIWAAEKGIYNNSTALAQLNGARAEIGELWDACKQGNIHEAKVELGDVLVFLINAAHMYNVSNTEIYDIIFYEDCSINSTVDECISEMYDTISEISDDAECMCLHIYINWMAEYLNTTVYDCLKLAYEKILVRSGKMVNGKFVKSSDLS